jgi:chromosome partitioning protein
MGRRSQETARGTEKMKVISAANQKGGVGKTNFIVHLAHDFIERGLKVLVLDTDPQGNASFSLSAYASKVTASQFFDDKPISLSSKEGITLVTGDPKMLNIEKLNISDVGDNIKRNLKLVSKQFDVCLIDTAPTLGVRLASVMYASDYVFTPIEVEAYSMLGVSLMRKTIANMSQLNPSLVNLGLIASRVDKRNPLHVRNLDSLKSNHADQLVPVVIGQRSSFGEALHSKVPVWNIKRTSARVAAKEMRDFAEYVFTKVELTND